MHINNGQTTTVGRYILGMPNERNDQTELCKLESTRYRLKGRNNIFLIFYTLWTD